MQRSVKEILTARKLKTTVYINETSLLTSWCFDCDKQNQSSSQKSFDLGDSRFKAFMIEWRHQAMSLNKAFLHGGVIFGSLV
ncbi:CLUMA_CG019722, isoform A [Clunio marinus]|uniref:CLUMA_CG019722, isoform A n=1 Tax=Clunio marinus TaxID=568069 RepID=A0A1J1J2S9_9DIPT|nr:CLUMA_CG019722, isoform A [Clunio marinus]